MLNKIQYTRVENFVAALELAVMIAFALVIIFLF